jgi:N-acetyl-gamma-glutamyl-phosphate reductase
VARGRGAGLGKVALQAAEDALAPGGGAADDEDRVIAGDGAGHVGPPELVERLGHGLGAGLEGADHDEGLDPLHTGDQLGEHACQLGAVALLVALLGEGVAHAAAVVGDAGEAELAEVAGEGGLRDLPPAPGEEAAERLLAGDGLGADDRADGLVTGGLVGHGGRGRVGPAGRRWGAGFDGGRMNVYALIVHTLPNSTQPPAAGDGRIPVGVLGASGYSGRELVALVLGHPRLSLAFASAHSQAGQVLRVRAAGRVHDVPLVATDAVDLSSAALVFAALPHGASATWVARAAAAGCRVVDLSSDLRPGRGGVTEALPPELAGPVPYGMPEVLRVLAQGAPGAAPPFAGVDAARVVANPGCYATSILVALAPLAAQGLIAPGGTVSIAAASGVSGAGATPRLDLLFAEVTEDYRAYGVGNSHRHLFEMRATLAALGADCDLLFTPHLLPVDRGILATITVPLARAVPGLAADPLAPFRAAYAGEPFVELTEGLPTVRGVAHRNVVQLAARVPSGMRHPTLLLFSAIDNLVKGAAGQAVQNANRMLGLDEAVGLPQ